ncbi:MAG: rhomboid family intramembrane serine protease [Lentisphaerae bacterium]|nr:rhomboid family intramembrane serine protease [Lentisphaerota bacterium]
MGLYDRDYMRPRRPSGTPEISGRKMMLWLIIANVIAYFLYHRIAPWCVLTIQKGDGSFHLRYLWQLFSAGFMHADFWHLFFNMWGLYIFGSLVAQHLNGIKFLLLYLAGAVFGNLLFIVCNLNPANNTGLLGASGAVCAMMTAAATMEPERRFIMLFMPFPVKTTTLVVCYTAMEILYCLSGRNTGIAHLAHLGGFIGGYIIMKIFFGKALIWDPLRKFSGSSRPRTATFQREENISKEDTYSFNGEKRTSARVTQKELDYLLDKLSNQGINSLSEYELERLRQARKQMRGEE